MVFVRLSARALVQVGALSGLGAVGNYNQVAVARVYHDGRVYEVPVLTGNALKHWHSVYTAEEYVQMGGSYLNDLCRMGIGYRGLTHDAKLGNLKSASDECSAILDLCNDLHGYLIAEEKRSSKRDSLVKVAFAVPVLEAGNLEATSKFAVQHNRVVPESVRDELGQRQAMMVFKQEYATGLYGFYIRLDLDKVLVPMFENCNVNGVEDLEKERKLRVKAAVAALLKTLTGSGSKQARALPIVDVTEVLVAVSKGPIPNLVHAAYPDYCMKSLDILEAYKKVSGVGDVKVFYYGGQDCKGEGVERVDKLSELFKKLVEAVGDGGASGEK